jgi:serine/threonine protein phosphatase 1
MQWVVGDIHGMLTPLEALLRAVSAYDRDARFLFTGDYVNRGPDSRGVVDLLLKLEAGGARVVRGNHDDLFDLMLNEQCASNRSLIKEPIADFARMVQNGVAETLTSYGVARNQVLHLVDHPSRDGLRRLLEAVPETHRAFFRRLPLVIDEDEFFVAHAYLPPDAPDRTNQVPTLARTLDASPRLRHDILWNRFTESEIRRQKDWSRTGFFGHSPVAGLRGWRGIGNVPIRGPQIVLLDTGAAAARSGRLTAVCVEDGNFLQSDRDGRVVGAA